MGQTEIRLFVLVTLLALAAVWDISLRRVPNWLILFGWLLGFLWEDAFVYLFRSLAVAALLYPLWERRLLGGGDCKLISLLFGWLGLRPAALGIFYSLLFAGVFGICRLLFYHSFLLRFSYLYQYFKSGDARKGLPYEGKGRQTAEIPFAAFLLAGTLLVLFL